MDSWLDEAAQEPEDDWLASVCENEEEISRYRPDPDVPWLEDYELRRRVDQRGAPIWTTECKRCGKSHSGRQKDGVRALIQAHVGRKCDDEPRWPKVADLPEYPIPF